MIEKSEELESRGYKKKIYERLIAELNQFEEQFPEERRIIIISLCAKTKMPWLIFSYTDHADYTYLPDDQISALDTLLDKVGFTYIDWEAKSTGNLVVNFED